MCGRERKTLFYPSRLGGGCPSYERQNLWGGDLGQHLTVLYSTGSALRTTPDSAGGRGETCRIPGVEPGFAVCKANALPIMLLLWLHKKQVI